MNGLAIKVVEDIDAWSIHADPEAYLGPVYISVQIPDSHAKILEQYPIEEGYDSIGIQIDVQQAEELIPQLQRAIDQSRKYKDQIDQSEIDATTQAKRDEVRALQRIVLDQIKTVERACGPSPSGTVQVSIQLDTAKKLVCGLDGLVNGDK